MEGLRLLNGIALLTTKSDEEYERLNMIAPVSQEIQDFFNLYQDTPEMWVHDNAAIEFDAIRSIHNCGFGYVRVDGDDDIGFTFKCEYDELIKTLGN